MLRKPVGGSPETTQDHTVLLVEEKELDVEEIGLVFEITGGTLHAFVTENVLKTVLDRWLILVHLTHPYSLFFLVSPYCKDSVSFNPIVCVLCIHIS